MRKFNLGFGAIVLVAALGLAGVVRADTITATLIGLNPFSGATLTAEGHTINGGGVGELIWSGDPANASPFNGNYITFCIDLQEEITYNVPYEFAIIPDISLAPKPSASIGSLFPSGMGNDKANLLKALFAAHYGSLDTTDFISGDIIAGTPAGDLLQAFQLSVWALVYDDPTTTGGVYDVTDTSSIFYESGVDATAADMANTWLAEALASSGPFQQNLQALEGLSINQDDNAPFAQDQIVVNPNIPTGGSVPLPSAALGGAVLMAGLGLMRIKAIRFATI